MEINRVIKKAKQAGFSLIETLIVLIVVMIILSLTVAQYTNVTASFHRQERVFSLCPRAQVNRRTGTIAQLKMPGYKVGVEVREEHMANVQSLPFRIFEIDFDVSLRIDDDGCAGRLIRDQIGCMRKAAQVILFEDHVGVISRGW